MSKTDNITLTLERNVALVLFDFLARVADKEHGAPLRGAILHEAELPALWSLLNGLEEVLAEPFAVDYPKRLRKRAPASSSDAAAPCRDRGAGRDGEPIRELRRRRAQERGGWSASSGPCRAAPRLRAYW